MVFRYLYLIVLIIKFIQINCHGRLLVPPARSSAWREDPIKFPINYNDNAMFCGGFNALWQISGGKCGICGENYSGPKLYEKGGPLYRGYVVRTYNQGDTINAIVDVTASHNGYFEFRICNVDKLSGDATQECLNQNLLTDLNSQTKIFVPKEATGKIITTLKLPQDLACNHCVLQWKYNSGNSWGTDPITGQSCIGCGPQEQFYGCADISIKQIAKRELKGYPQFYIPSKPSYPNVIDQPGYNPIYQLDKTLYYRNIDEDKTKITTNLLRRLINELSNNKKYESDLHESQDENINNESNLFQREVINGGGDPAAQEQHAHKDKTL